MEIICGRQGTGKTDQVFKRIKALPKTCSIYLIVPEQATYETECALLDALGADGAIHIRVTGLMRFVRGLAHATPLNAHTVMTDDAKTLAVKCIIDTVASALATYRRRADKKGFADDAVRLIGELKEARVTLADLQRAAGGADGALGAKLSDVAAIYTRYEETASDGRLDPDDFMAAAAEYVCGMKDIGASYFFFDSFHTFDASSYPLITQLIRCAADVCFTLTTGEGDFFEITRSTLEKLTQAAADAAKPVRTTYLTGKKDSADALCFLEENLPRYATKRFENPNGAVCLREYDSIEEEAAGVAADICAYVRENGARYSDIGVAVSDLAVYGPVVEAVFKRYGIPVYIDSRKSVAYFAPVRALLLMLNMAQKPFSTEDIIAFAKTGFAPVGYRECEDIENYCLQYAVSGRRWHGDFTFDPERDYDLAYINGIRARLTACTDAFAEEYAAQKTVGGQCRTAYGFVESHLSEKIAQSAQQDEDAAKPYVQVYNKMLDIIECAYGLFEDTPADTSRPGFRFAVCVHVRRYRHDSRHD
jgi:ATP-dependent helicase/nuclease subunit B